MTLPLVSPNLDLQDPHYRYRWRAQYDSLAEGDWVDEFDSAGAPRSVGVLEWPRVVRIQLLPMWEGYPPIELRVDPAQGQKAIKHWQTDMASDGSGGQVVREVLGMQINVAGKAIKIFLLSDPSGALVLTTNPNL